MEQRFQELLKNNEKYKSFDVQKIRETLPGGASYDVFEFEKVFLGLNTNDFSEIKVPSDSFFVLGDNRDNSQGQQIYRIYTKRKFSW